MLYLWNKVFVFLYFCICALTIGSNIFDILESIEQFAADQFSRGPICMNHPWAPP